MGIEKCVLWNGRYHGACRMNHHQPHQMPVFIQRRWFVYIVGLEGSPLLWGPSGKPNDQFQQVLLPVRPTENRIWQKASRIS